MKSAGRILVAGLVLLLGGVAVTAAQPAGDAATTTKSAPSPFKASLSVGIGAETLYDPTQSGNGTFPVTYQMLTLAPSFQIGELGIGLDLILNYRFDEGTDIYGNPTNQAIYLRPQDWSPSPVTAQSVLALYLPKIAYVSWGDRGDPLYVRLGQLAGTTLGNGFIVDGATNTLFAPDQRFFGAYFNIAGRLVHFPSVDLQGFTDDLTTLDFGGGEFSVRPLARLTSPILSGLRIGIVAAFDRNPYKFLDPAPAGTPTPVTIIGGDLSLPLISDPLASVTAMGSIAREPESFGEMVGIRGRLFKIVTYRTELRFLGSSFVPSYFDSTYDAFRLQRYEVAIGQVSQPATVGYLASLGISALSDRLVFRVSVDGPFEAPPAGSTSIAAYPHVKALFTLSPGVLPGFFLEGSYEKFFITSLGDLNSPDDLFNPTNSVISSSVNFKTGPAVITLFYDLVYNPNAAPGATSWQVTSGLGSSISLF